MTNIFILILLLFSHFVYSEDILGCGGFVKSDVIIKFSRVEIKLYTRQGSLKYQTDCAPNNGYYLIPLYDKGDYILKVEPPSGWVFEPSNVFLHVDGSSDLCSLGQDINFTFKGFSIFGKVVSRGKSEGPPGVTVILKDNNGEILQQTQTSTNGEYAFSKILPGNYIVEASHSKWLLDKSEVPIHVKQDNGKVGNAIVVSGYDVRGEVNSEGESIKGVHFLVFSKGKLSYKENFLGCNKEIVKGFNSYGELEYLCYVTSDTDGIFLFQSLPSGNYKLMPFYKGEHIEFDVFPPEVDFVVEHGSVIFHQKFQVQGFSVSGRVVAVPNGKGLKGAKVYLNGEERTTTYANGIYHLENMRTGTYLLQVEMQDIKFDPLSVKITPNTPQLPEVVASEFSICGSINIDHMPLGIEIDFERVISLRVISKDEIITVTVDESGHFCSFLKSGTYILKPFVGILEEAGLKFTPPEKHVTVLDEPVLNVQFLQFKGNVCGQIFCLEKCGNIKITLCPMSVKSTVKETFSSHDGTFKFEDCLPGKYNLSIYEQYWCWKEKTVEVEVSDLNADPVKLYQTGYHVSLNSSHPTALKVKFPSGINDTLILNEGLNTYCFSEPGIYDFIPIGCHLFNEKNLRFSSGDNMPLKLTAYKHQVSGTVFSEQNTTDIVVTVKKKLNGRQEAEIIPLKQPQSKEKKFIYPFILWVEQHAELDIHVSSSTLLFRPLNAQIKVMDDCIENAAVFIGKKGLFIHGEISPPLDEVEITVLDTNGMYPSIKTASNKNGKFLVGPLDSECHFEVAAKKIGFVFIQLSKLGHFKAVKLADVTVEVRGENNEPLSGVLLSLSGGLDYRKNSLTQKDGSLLFSGLSSGQYFLRPMLKEYQFEPAAKMMEITEGATIRIQVSGTRVAFSCYGMVNSLTGEAEPEVAIEALGRGSMLCQQYQEEAISEQDGTFRIRGLQPHCTYIIKLKHSADGNQHIERATPKEKAIKVTDGDITGVRLIVFRRFNQMDLSGNIVTLQKFIPSLKIRLFREDSPDQAVHTLTLGQSSFFQLPSLPIDNRTYIMRLDTSLPSSSFHLDFPFVTFSSNSSYSHFTLHFHPQSRSVDQEMTQGSLLALPLTVVIGALVYNYAKVLPLLNHFLDLFQVLVNPAHTTSTAEGMTPELVPNRRKTKPRKT